MCGPHRGLAARTRARPDEPGGGDRSVGLMGAVSGWPPGAPVRPRRGRDRPRQRSAGHIRGAHASRRKPSCRRSGRTYRDRCCASPRAHRRPTTHRPSPIAAACGARRAGRVTHGNSASLDPAPGRAAASGSPGRRRRCARRHALPVGEARDRVRRGQPPRRLVEDDRRQNALVRAGFQVLRYTASDLFQTPDLIVIQIRQALRDLVSGTAPPAAAGSA